MTRAKGKRIFMIQNADGQYSNGGVPTVSDTKFTSYGKFWRGIKSVKKHLKSCFFWSWLIGLYQNTELVEFELTEISRTPIDVLLKEVRKDLIIERLENESIQDKKKV